MDWFELLRQRGETARVLAVELPLVLKRDDLSFGDAKEMLRLLGRFRHFMASAVAEMEKAEVEEYLLDLADSIAIVFRDLHEETEARLHELRASPVSRPRVAHAEFARMC